MFTTRALADRCSCVPASHKLKIAQGNEQSPLETSVQRLRNARGSIKSRASTESRAPRCRHEFVTEQPSAACIFLGDWGLSTQGDRHDHHHRTPQLHSGSRTCRCRIDRSAGGKPCIRPRQPTEWSEDDAIPSETSVTGPEVDQGHLGKSSGEPLRK